MDQVISELRFSQAGTSHTATLTDDLRWQCDDESLERLLNESFGRMDLTAEVTQWHEPVIHGVYQVAERLGAEVQINHRRRIAV